MNHKCYFDLKGRYNPCPGMCRMLDLLEPQMEVKEIFNLKTGSGYQLGPVINPKKKIKLPGLALNNCPFCLKPIINNQNRLVIPDDKIEFYQVSQ